MNRWEDKEVIFQLASHIRHRAVGDEGVILDQRSAEIIIVNQLGEEILDILQNNSSIDEIVKKLIKKYDIEESTVKEDVQGYLSALQSTGIIEQVTI